MICRGPNAVPPCGCANCHADEFQAQGRRMRFEEDMRVWAARLAWLLFAAVLGLLFVTEG